ARAAHLHAGISGGHRAREPPARGRPLPRAARRPRREHQRAHRLLAHRRATHVTSGGAPPRRPLRRFLGRALLPLCIAWTLLAAAFAARDFVVVNGFPSPMRVLFGDEVRVPRCKPLKAVANAMRGPVRVGLQVGHLHAGDQPDELAELRYSTGAHWDGLDEVEVNAIIAAELAERLEERGFVVDLLPATVPQRYRADLLLS